MLMYFLSPEWWSFKQKSVITIENENIYSSIYYAVYEHSPR